jgi:hypothetical protein
VEVEGRGWYVTALDKRPMPLVLSEALHSCYLSFFILNTEILQIEELDGR